MASIRSFLHRSRRRVRLEIQRVHGTWRRWLHYVSGRWTLLAWTRDHICNERRKKTIPRIRITPEVLRQLSDSIPSQFNDQTQALAIASGVLRVFFGGEWVEKHVISNSGKRGFLSVKERDPIKLEISFFRIMDLAELLYNLQYIPGFDQCIFKMRQGDIEGTLAELNVARMLFLNKVPFRFVIPQGEKKRDYDFDILCPNGQVACADAKCKIDETNFSENGIRNVLNDARKQLPNDRPGIIFIKTPEHWLADDAFRNRALLVARRFLGGVRRIVSVKFYVEPINFSKNVMRIDLSTGRNQMRERILETKLIGTYFGSTTCRLRQMVCRRTTNASFSAGSESESLMRNNRGES